jgi:hypothetical protein
VEGPIADAVERAQSPEPSREGIAVRDAAVPLTAPAGCAEWPIRRRWAGVARAGEQGCPLLVVEIETKRLNTREVTHGSLYRNRRAFGKLHSGGDGSGGQAAPPPRSGHAGESPDRLAQRGGGQQVRLHRGRSADGVAGGSVGSSREGDDGRPAGAARRPEERCGRCLGACGTNPSTSTWHIRLQTYDTVPVVARGGARLRWR